MHVRDGACLYVLSRTLAHKEIEHEKLMADNYIGHGRVVKKTRRGAAKGNIRVLLRRGDKTEWKEMSLKEYERRSVLKQSASQQTKEVQ